MALGSTAISCSASFMTSYFCNWIQEEDDEQHQQHDFADDEGVEDGPGYHGVDAMQEGELGPVHACV
jgi:hypothetical protein